MPICCPTLRNLCNATCEEKEYQISSLWAGCISHFTYGYTADELTSLALVEVVDPEDDPTTGLVQFCFEGEDFDLIEDGTYDRATGLVNWTDSTESLKIYSALTTDDQSVRGLLGKQIWGIVKLKGKSGDDIFRTFGLGGGVYITQTRRSVKGQNWEILLEGNGDKRQIYATLGVDADATEAAIIALLLP
jgi:hypothetical protein